jgi:hypothetical protein
LRLEEFLHGVDDLDDVIHSLILLDEIARAPDDAELLEIRNHLFSLLVHRRQEPAWKATEDDLKALLYQMVPGLRLSSLDVSRE